MERDILSLHGRKWSNDDPKPYFENYALEHSVTFPKSFMDFYSHNNGICISNNDYEFVINLEHKFGEREDIRFEGLYPAEDIFLNYKIREGVAFPQMCVPFVCIEQAEIFMSIRDDSFGKIYFCELDPIPEQMREESFEDAMEKFMPSKDKYPGIIFKICDNFDDFLNMINVEEW